MQCIGRIFCIPPLLVAGTINYPAYLCPSQGSGTHHARFYGDIERAILQVLSAQHVGARGNGLHFGVGGYVGEHLREVVGTRDNPVLTYDDGSHGNLVFIECGLCLHQGTAHEFFVFLLIVYHISILYDFSFPFLCKNT